MLKAIFCTTERTTDQQSMQDKQQLLIMGYGNPARGDDGLAPEFISRLNKEQQGNSLPESFNTLLEFQLQIENTLDLEKYPLVLLVDASSAITSPFTLTLVHPKQDCSYSSHALSPAALLSVFEKTSEKEPPALYLLAIGGFYFELGEELSSKAERNLEQALDLTRNLIRQQKLAYWNQCITL